MRIRAAASASLLALVLLAACSDDDDPAVDASGSASASDVEAEATDDEATVDAEETEDEEAAPDADAQAAIDGAQLEAADLGPGWTLSSTTPAGDDPAEDEPNPLDECVDSSLQDEMDAAQVAESEERTFTSETEGQLVPAQVASQLEALDDASLFTETHEILRSEDFRTCMVEAFETLMAEQVGDSGGEVTLGEVTVTEDVVDVDGAESTRFGVPLSVSSDGFDLEVAFGITFVNVDELGASLFAFGADGAITAEQEAEWAGLLAERLAAA